MAKRTPESGTSSDRSVTNYRSVPRIEPADVLVDWVDYASWRTCTSRMLRVVGVMEGETLLANCKDHAMAILTGRLSKSNLRQGVFPYVTISFVLTFSWK